MDYRIAIPSYKRSKTINEKTIAYLKRTDINLDLVDVFISDENEYDLYKNNVDVNIIKGKIGCGGNKKTLLEIKDLNLMIKENFEISLSKNNNLWGIYPVHNAFFMKTNISFGLKYVIGCFYGVVNNHKKHAFVELEDKEDFERTIKYFLNDKGVTRFNYIAPNTVYYKEAGGMQETRTKERVKSSALILAKKYPSLCKVFISKKGYYEIRFKNIKKKI